LHVHWSHILHNWNEARSTCSRVRRRTLHIHYATKTTSTVLPDRYRTPPHIKFEVPFVYSPRSRVCPASRKLQCNKHDWPDSLCRLKPNRLPNALPVQPQRLYYELRSIETRKRKPSCAYDSKLAFKTQVLPYSILAAIDTCRRHFP
jgi:hypothetical protein